MGLYDTMNQGKSNVVPQQVGGGQAAVPNGGSFAQKQMMQKNPMMKRPAMNPAMQAGGMGSRAQIQAKQLMQQNKAAMAPGGNGVTSGSYGQMIGKNPQLESLRQTGTAAGQNMGWMDKPGALSMGTGQTSLYGSTPDQSGLSPLQSPYEQQIMQQKMAANPDIQMGASQAGPAVGNYGQTMGRELQAPPYGGEQPGSNSFQSMLASMGGQRPDVMSRGIGPSAEMFGGQPMNEMQSQQPVVMDENGLEPRRGAR